jgi:tetratricopeptide (TPR) repeat protein
MPVNLIKNKINNEDVTALKDAGIVDDKETADYWFQKGYSFYEAEKYKEAIEAYRQAIRIKPDYAEAHYNLGCAYDNLGMHKEAIEAYKQAIRIKPNFAEVHDSLGLVYYNLGCVYAEQRNYQEAIESYKQAIRSKPNYAEAYNNLGWAYLDVKDYQKAIESFREAIRIKPDYDKAHNNLRIASDKSADSLAQQGNRIRNEQSDKEAQKYYDEAMERINIAFRIKWPEGINSINKGDIISAIAKLNLVIQLKPDHAGAHSTLGYCYVVLDYYEMALGEYEILNSLDENLAANLLALIEKCRPKSKNQENVICSSCDGKGSVICSLCDGTGNSSMACISCRGTGIISGFRCYSCKGCRFNKCVSCDGTGQIKCSSCNGTGCK